VASFRAKGSELYETIRIFLIYFKFSVAHFGKLNAVLDALTLPKRVSGSHLSGSRGLDCEPRVIGLILAP
jgi:hypothetical protein